MRSWARCWQHARNDRRARLRLEFVSDDRNAGLGETLRPYRIAGDEDGDVVHECDASLQRAFRVKLGRFLASDRQIVHQDLGPAFPQHAHDLRRSEAQTSELQSLMRISSAVFCLKKKHKTLPITHE